MCVFVYVCMRVTLHHQMRIKTVRVRTTMMRDNDDDDGGVV